MVLAPSLFTDHHLVCVPHPGNGGMSCGLLGLTCLVSLGRGSDMADTVGMCKENLWQQRAVGSYYSLRQVVCSPGGTGPRSRPLAVPSSTGTGSDFCLLTAWWRLQWTSCQPLGRGSAVALCPPSLARALAAASVLAHLWDDRPQPISPLAFTKAVSCCLQAHRVGRSPQQ